jgi:HlyD family secretion protein
LAGRGRIGVAVIATVLAVAGVATYTVASRPTRTAAASSTAEVARGPVTVTASAAGAVNMVQTRGLDFAVVGVVTELNVKVGDQVTPGKVLARIDGTDAQNSVNAAQAQVDAARLALDRANQPVPTTNLCPAAYVVTSPSDASPSDASPPDAIPSSAPPTNSPGPTRSPGPTGSPRPTGGPLPSARPSSPGPTRTAPGGAATGRACTTAAPGNTGRAGGDALASAQQQLNNAELAYSQAQRQLAGTVLTAPVTGRVVAVTGTLGTLQRPGGTGFITLGDVADTAVQAEFSEADVTNLAVGQPASVTLPNRPDEIPAKVSRIAPAGTVSGRLVRYAVVVAFDATPPDLLLGQSANVVVTTARVDNVLYVPSSAVTGVHDGTAIVAVRSGGRNQRRTVTIGLRGDRFTEIRSGLDEGEQVVV